MYAHIQQTHEWREGTKNMIIDDELGSYRKIVPYVIVVFKIIDVAKLTSHAFSSPLSSPMLLLRRHRSVKLKHLRPRRFPPYINLSSHHPFSLTPNSIEFRISIHPSHQFLLFSYFWVFQIAIVVESSISLQNYECHDCLYVLPISN